MLSNDIQLRTSQYIMASCSFASHHCSVINLSSQASLSVGLQCEDSHFSESLAASRQNHVEDVYSLDHVRARDFYEWAVELQSVNALLRDDPSHLTLQQLRYQMRRID